MLPCPRHAPPAPGGPLRSPLLFQVFLFILLELCVCRREDGTSVVGPGKEEVVVRLCRCSGSLHGSKPRTTNGRRRESFMGVGIPQAVWCNIFPLVVQRLPILLRMRLRVASILHCWVSRE